MLDRLNLSSDNMEVADSDVTSNQAILQAIISL